MAKQQKQKKLTTREKKIKRHFVAEQVRLERETERLVKAEEDALEEETEHTDRKTLVDALTKERDKLRTQLHAEVPHCDCRCPELRQTLEAREGEQLPELMRRLRKERDDAVRERDSALAAHAALIVKGWDNRTTDV